MILILQISRIKTNNLKINKIKQRKKIIIRNKHYLKKIKKIIKSKEKQINVQEQIILQVKNLKKYKNLKDKWHYLILNKLPNNK